MIRLVAFDFGGVLVDISFSRAAEALGVPTAAFRNRLFCNGGDAIHRAMGLGATPEDFIQRIATEFDTEIDLAERAWAAIVRPFPGAEALVSAVDAFVSDDATPNLAVCAWSNIDAIHTRRLRPAFPTLLNRHRALSFEVGAAKPQSAFFLDAVERSGVAANEILFIDDSKENVTTAQTLGVVAHFAEGLAAVRDVLHSSLGLSLAPLSPSHDPVEGAKP